MAPRTRGNYRLRPHRLPASKRAPDPRGAGRALRPERGRPRLRSRDRPQRGGLSAAGGAAPAAEEKKEEKKEEEKEESDGKSHVQA